MKTPLIAIAAIAVLFASVTLAGNAIAQKSGKDQVQEIMTAYQKAIDKAKSEFSSAVKKANEDARAAIGKNIPTDKINSDSKAAISKARAEFKAAKDAAQKEATQNLKKLQAVLKP